MKCLGFDCVRSDKDHDASTMKFCARCSKPICPWCLIHCSPTHTCDTNEDVKLEMERYRQRPEFGHKDPKGG